MIKIGLFLGLVFISSSAFAGEHYTSTVTDVTEKYESLAFLPDLVPTPTPSASDDQNASTEAPTTPSNDDSSPGTGNGIGSILGKVDLSQIITLGEKIWNFILTNKPDAQYNTLKTSVVPAGITNWAQLQQWSKPISKVYHVAFTGTFGQSGGGFDYRLTYFYGGSYKGKGKFLGEISVIPSNIQLNTGRSLKMNVEMASVMNFGTEKDPVAGAQIIVSWTSPTTTHYDMQSAEYVLYGTGEIQDLTNGN